MRGHSVLPPPIAQHLPAFIRQRLATRPGPEEHSDTAVAPAWTAQDIRRRSPGDLSACARLAVVASAGRPHRPAWRAWLTSAEVLDAWVVERQGELLGHVALADVGLDEVSALRWREVTGHDPSALVAVSRLFVRPRVRGQGIGSALLEIAIAEARARGRIPVVEAVGYGASEIDLYDSRGWRLAAMYPARTRADGLNACFYVLPPQPSAGSAHST